ncbi:MAG: hypothetical protein DYG98_14980 [Haliscomenobacteraceae bacterium CHB4]|nr:hypothetical protein [Saprospiraceae bacterium]MCE7924348.1 hypothetical protein [Haliscomenobacteraceae bacterium CHB4]
MDQPSGNLPNETYINGLLDNDQSVLEAIYADFFRPVVHSVVASGGSEAAGKSFFRTALVEAAKMARTRELTADFAFPDLLNALATAHFKDWLAERGQAAETEEGQEEAEYAVKVPVSEALRATRATIDGWKKREGMDEAGYPLWETIRRVEQNFAESEKPRPKSNFNRNLLIGLGLLIAAWSIYVFFFQSKTPAQVYDDNFSLPQSLMSDLRERYGPERGNDSVSARPNACEMYLQQADQFYKAKDYVSAQAVLFEILEDSLTVCHSDALFYIGIMALQQEEPELALECFSKIEDIEHFGEDIYWYQALAFVKLAEYNPLLRDKAARAIERARANAQDSLRRMQAEKMLKQLSR